jgi:hypothetical protein
MHLKEFMNIFKIMVFTYTAIYMDGCATYKADKIPVADYKSIQTSKPTLSIKTSYTRLRDGKTLLNDEDAKKRKVEIEAEFISEIEKTGLYKIDNFESNPNLTMNATIEDSENIPNTCILTFFSLWILPCTVPTETTVKATVINNETNTVSNIIVNDGVNLYHSLFLIPFGLFKQYQPITKDVRSNIISTIAIKAYQASINGCTSYITQCQIGFTCDETSRDCKKIDVNEKSSKSQPEKKVLGIENNLTFPPIKDKVMSEKSIYKPSAIFTDSKMNLPALNTRNSKKTVRNNIRRQNNNIDYKSPILNPQTGKLE